MIRQNAWEKRLSALLPFWGAFRRRILPRVRGDARVPYPNHSPFRARILSRGLLKAGRRAVQAVLTPLLPVLRSLCRLLDHAARHPVASVNMYAVDRCFYRRGKKGKQRNNRAKAPHEILCFGK